MAIFDLGCGNGNHLGLYLKHVPAGGRVAGLDRETSSSKKRERGFQESRISSFGSVQWTTLSVSRTGRRHVLLNFAIYNASTPRKTLTELKSVMRAGGDLVLIGPTRNNARELYDSTAV